MNATSVRCMRRRLARAAIYAVAGLWVGTTGVSVSHAQHAQGAAAQSARSGDAKLGEYLARIGDCVACHTTRGGAEFAGGLEMATPFGTLFTPNITPDRETGIGKWSAEDFWRALHLGRAPDGSSYYPAFPYPNYTRVSRADADAIFAYLKSIKPVRKHNRPHTLGFPFNQRALLNAWRTLYFEPGEYEPAPSQTTEWNRGAYLVQGLGHCDACHTGRNILGATRTGDAFAGGVMPVQEWYAPSLTSNRESGLGQWDIEDIVDFLHTGVSKRGAVYGPMSQVVYDSLQYMTEADVRAMAVYLKSLLPKGSAAQPAQVRPTEQQGKDLYEAGAKLYEKWCAECHLSNGAGIPPAYPPLANNQSISMDFAANPIRLVMFGGYPPATKRNPRPYGMPPFAQALSDNEIAAIVTYIRQSWGNRAAPVSHADVARYRSVPLE
jgi:mono/diheme cytochrome c family protein